MEQIQIDHAPLRQPKKAWRICFSRANLLQETQLVLQSFGKDCSWVIRTIFENYFRSEEDNLELNESGKNLC